MNISAIPAAIQTGTPLPVSETAEVSRSKAHLEIESRDNDHGCRRGHRRGHSDHRALGAFHQELKARLKFEFKAQFSMQQQGYAAVTDDVSSDDVAADALQTAKKLTAESPTTAAKSLISLKARVHETASYVRQTVGGDDLQDVDDAVAKVDAGISKLEDEVANSRESSASVLEVDTRTKQRSTIRIRTQEGDVVKLSLRRTDSLSATDTARTDGENASTTTEVAVSSRSRMMLKVDGDLNDAELAAIQNVFAQAEQIANDFFGGDLQAAFASAEGFEFDAEQLARVNMRFRMQQHSAISYRETSSIPTVEADSRPAAIARGPETPVVESAPVVNPETETADVVETSDMTAEPVAAEVTEDAAPITNNGFSSFIESVSNFLRAVGEGFASQSDKQSIRMHYSESFKLEFLKAVFHTAAPEEAEGAAATAKSTIDRMLEIAGE